MRVDRRLNAAEEIAETAVAQLHPLRSDQRHMLPPQGVEVAVGMHAQLPRVAEKRSHLDGQNRVLVSEHAGGQQNIAVVVPNGQRSWGYVTRYDYNTSDATDLVR